MVECIYDLDDVFDSLGDKTRRDILRLVSKYEMSVGEIAQNFRMSFAGVSKHIKVLESAKLIDKRRRGKEQLVSANKQAIEFAAEHLERYQTMWQSRHDKLQILISKE